METYSVLLVDDDKKLLAILQECFLQENFTVYTAMDGGAALAAFEQHAPSIIILDLMLPGLDGFQICREVRKTREIPILMVSARREDIDKIRGLGLGADDYIIKPFSPSELTARVKAHLSRYERLLANNEKSTFKSIQCGDLEIQPDTHRVFQAGKEITLTNREFELLLFLAENPGFVFSKDRLFEQVWGLDAAGDTATVVVHVNRLREKIEPEPAKPIYIETVWGAGYRFHG